jgi:aldose sugar dehydrogenase
MRPSRPFSLTLAVSAVVATAVVLASGPNLRKQTLAPHELNEGDAPPPILRDTPALPKGNINFDSAEEGRLRAAIVTKGLQQPWSLAFLPDGAMLVTERAGRLRIIRNGILDRSPVAGLPPVQTGGPRGLQGLMDVVLHPRFRENGWVYLAYHRPLVAAAASLSESCSRLGNLASEAPA